MFNKMNMFLYLLFLFNFSFPNLINYNIDLIHNIIKHISFTKEFNERQDNKDPLKMIKYFESDKEQLLRDIVSDADKIESLGHTGIIRIIQYQNAI